MKSIILYPDPSLKIPSEKVSVFQESLHSLLDDMREVITANNALGLAAPQIGIKCRVIIIKDLSGNLTELVNPEVIEKEGVQYEEEGCLSFPGIFSRVVRSEQVHIKYHDRDGVSKTALVYGKEAIEFEHELDHLNGVLLTDKVNRKERQRINKVLGV